LCLDYDVTDIREQEPRNVMVITESSQKPLMFPWVCYHWNKGAMLCIVRISVESSIFLSNRYDIERYLFENREENEKDDSGKSEPQDYKQRPSRRVSEHRDLELLIDSFKHVFSSFWICSEKSHGFGVARLQCLSRFHITRSAI
jgi:hypothetical protein